MNEITSDRRLELLRNIREESERNRMNLRNHQNILYGNHYDNYVESEDNDMTNVSSKNNSSTFFFRTIIAIILFVLFVLWDYSGYSIWDLKSSTICTYIENNYDFNIIDFADRILYTNKDKLLEEE